MRHHQDFFVRMHEAEFIKLSLLHVRSELDPEAGEPVPDGSACKMRGSTEWRTQAPPFVSIGWDWYVNAAGDLALDPYSVRTNLMLVDDGGNDRGIGETLNVAIVTTHGSRWQDAVRFALRSHRYS